MTPTRRTGALALLAAALLASGCEEVEQIQDRFRDMTPHERYRASLEAAGLTGSALAHDWIEASRRSLDEPIEVGLPFQEEGFITREEPGAQAYRIHIGRGQRLTADVALDTEEDTRVFVDLFRVPETEGDPLRPVLSTDSVPGHFEHEPWRGGDFVLRLQPELLRGGRYHVTLRLEAQLAFPVEGRDTRAIQSVFGAPRDAGRRAHHGVDIFAPRNTPVLATSAGRVRRVQETPIGGRVVWLRDDVRDANIYYAHLERQSVVAGQTVKPGDTVGFVGNSGNARTTPTHLHFGIYRRGEGPVDPDPFLRRPPGALAPLEADLSLLGSWVRIANDGIRLRGGPSRRARVLRELDVYTALRVLGGSGDWYRVHLPDGTVGYVAARLTEGVDAPVETLVAAGQAVQAAPDERAPVMSSLDPGAEIGVLGRFGRYLLVEAPNGAPGWIASSD